MTKKERLMVLEKIAYMSDKELEEKAIRLTYESLGTQTERMYELGYDTEDIIEQEIARAAKQYPEECRAYYG